MKRIPLTNGKYATVDDEDFEYLNKWKWHLTKKGYAACNILIPNQDGTKKYKIFRMHRLILDAKTGEQVDHVDMDKLNNTRHNIRLCTHSENTRNVRIRKDSLTGFKGVRFCNKKKLFIARIQVDKRRIYLGAFKDKLMAAKTYDNAAIKYHGEYAKTNGYAVNS